jgi:hypothetical protein
MARQAFVLVRCAQTGRDFIGRFVEEGDCWNLAEMHPSGRHDVSDGRRAVPSLAGKFGVAKSFAGCPDCRNPSYVRCGTCRELTCWSGSKEFSCILCNAKGIVVGEVEEVRVDDFG